MFKWYFKDYFIDNPLLFWIGIVIIVLIILLTAYLVYKELRGNHANKWFT